jgi:hypothetical protein
MFMSLIEQYRAVPRRRASTDDGGSSERSAAWLAHFLGEEEVGRSNRLALT